MEQANDLIVFIDHHENPMDDIAWTWLGESGFKRKLVCPFRGETLDIDPAGLAGVVVYGGSQNVDEQTQYPFLKNEIRWLSQCMEARTPTLGICLGGQLLAHVLGGRVGPRLPRECEFGYYEVTPTEAGRSFLPQPMFLTQAHFQEFETPSCAVNLASSETFPNQAFQYEDFALGLQFHPEVTPTIFRRWQDADWAMYGEKGSQTREQQDALIEPHSSRQGDWFRATLRRLFGNPDARSAIGSQRLTRSA